MDEPPATLCQIGSLPHAQNNKTHFYKFITRSVAEVVLTNRTLRWTTPSHLNDPHDNRFELLSDVNREVAKRLALDKLWEAHYSADAPPPGNKFGELIQQMQPKFPTLCRDEFERVYGETIDIAFLTMPDSVDRFNRDIQEHMRSNKLLCLTESAGNTVMWAYYAEAHQGVVLRFRTVPAIDSPWSVARKVVYASAIPQLYTEETFSDLMSGRSELDREKILDILVYTKGEDWSDLPSKKWTRFTRSGARPRQVRCNRGWSGAGADYRSLR